MGQARDRTPQRLMISFFAELIGRVTPFALLKVLQQYDMLASKGLGPCHHSLWHSMGLPCYHEIQEWLNKNDVLHMSDIYSQ